MLMATGQSLCPAHAYGHRTVSTHYFSSLPGGPDKLYFSSLPGEPDKLYFSSLPGEPGKLSFTSLPGEPDKP